MTPELTSAMETALERLQSWKGRLLRIEELLSRAAGESWAFDRHWCTRTSFVLELQGVAYTISGASVTVEGLSTGQFAIYQLTLERVTAVELPDSTSVRVIERFGMAAERRSLFCLASSTATT